MKKGVKGLTDACIFRRCYRSTVVIAHVQAVQEVYRSNICPLYLLPKSQKHASACFWDKYRRCRNRTFEVFLRLYK